MSMTPASPSGPAVPQRFADRHAAWLLRHSTPPPSLFHYTTADGLLAMLRSRHLWATDSRFMNDPTELVYAANLMRSEVESELGRSGDPRKQELAAWIAAMLEEKCQNARIYLACFCTDGDLLSQWRGYGSFGGGYAIGFNPLQLFGRDRHELPPWRVLRQVVYDPDEQRTILRGWIQELCAPGVDWRWQLERNFPTLFSEWLVVFKDPSYREEGEWRLIQFGREFEGDPSRGQLCWWWPTQFRTRRGEVIPYADLDLAAAPAAAPAGPLIRDIVLGPTVESSRAEKALRLCTDLGGHPPPKFSVSKIPFVA